MRRSIRQTLGVIAVLTVALLWRLAGITLTSVWHDEAFTTWAVRMPTGRLITTITLEERHPPLAYLIFKGWSLISLDDVFLRLLSVLLGVMTVLFLMLWVRRSVSLQAVIHTMLSDILILHSTSIAMAISIKEG